MPLPSSGGIAETQILTLNGDFGAYLVPEGTGVVLNNSLPDFNNRVNLGVSTGPNASVHAEG